METECQGKQKPVICTESLVVWVAGSTSSCVSNVQLKEGTALHTFREFCRAGSVPFEHLYVSIINLGAGWLANAQAKMQAQIKCSAGMVRWPFTFQNYDCDRNFCVLIIGLIFNI